jgi:branched-chain amino acid transport system substrate-binding protein
MNRRKLGLAAVAAGLLAALAVGAGFTYAPAEQRQGGQVYLGMISPLTGPLSFVGVDNRAAAVATVRWINAHGGVKGRKIVLDIVDDGSNPSQGVIAVQKFINDPKYLGVIGSGFSSVSLAAEPLATQAHLPYISMASSAAQVTPARPYVYMTTATSRLFAYAMARYLRGQGVKRIALMGDNGGFGREGVANVKQLARAFGFTIVNETIFPLTSTSFTAELSKIKDSGAQALWLWNATALAVTIVREAKQLQLPQRLVLSGGNASTQFLGPVCPDANGALIDTYLANVYKFLPKSNPSRAHAAMVARLLQKTPSTFNYDGYTAVQMYKAAMIKGGFSREGINRSLETKMRGFVGPGGKYYYSAVNHAGLQTASMVVSRIGGCNLRPVFGPALKAKKKK